MTPRIDLHCHAFNLSDIPAGGYLSMVILAIKPRILRRIVEALAADLADLAPTATSELLELSEIGVASTGGIESSVDLQIATTLYRLEEETGGVIEMMQEDANALLRIQNRKGRRELLQTDDQIRLQAFAYPIGLQARNVAFHEFTGLVNTMLHLTDTAESERLQGDFGLFRYIQWIKRTTRRRADILSELLESYGRGRNGIELFTPAMVDFRYWLDRNLEHPGSSLTAQLDLMEALSRSSHGRAHFFAPFNPLREIVDGGALELAPDAARNRGFVGIKLYPPMGFRLFNNEGVSYERYRKTLHPRVPRHYLPTLGTRIDGTLAKLYRACSNDGIPILSHCAESQIPTGRPKKSAWPAHWMTMLERLDLAGAAPAICLAHFGGIENLFGGGDGIEKAIEWVNAITSVIDDPASNAHTDLSDFVDLKKRTPRFRHWLNGFYHSSYPDRENRLMYGSDWFMLARTAGWKRYPADMRAAVKGRPEASKFFGGAAFKFLFGQSDNAGMGRMKDYYQSHQLKEPGWLARTEGG